MNYWNMSPEELIFTADLSEEAMVYAKLTYGINPLNQKIDYTETDDIEHNQYLMAKAISEITNERIRLDITNIMFGNIAEIDDYERCVVFTVALISTFKSKIPARKMSGWQAFSEKHNKLMLSGTWREETFKKIGKWHTDTTN